MTESQPRILFINRIAPFSKFGAGLVIWALGEAMARQNWDVHYLSPRPQTESIPVRENTTLHLVSVPGNEYVASYPFLVAGSIRLARLLKQLRPDILYDNCSPAPFIPAYAMSTRIVTRIHHIYGRDVFRFKDGLLNPMVTYLGEQWFRTLDPNRIIIDSESAKERLASFVRGAQRARVISPGIDLEDLPSADSGAGRDTKMVLALSRLAPNKGLEYLLRAWQLVESEHSAAHLNIAGTGPQEGQLKALGRHLRLRRVTFVGYVSDEEKWRLLSTCGVFAFPTLIEGLPISILEAMAMGSPIVSTSTWGVRDLIEDSKNGLLVQPANPRELAAAILRLLDDPRLATALAHRARDQVRERDVQRVAQEEIDHLSSLFGLGRHPSSR